MNRLSDSLRVVIVAETALPYLSGVTVATDALARGLTAAGHQVLLLAPRPADPTSQPPAADEASGYARRWLASYQLPRPVPPGYRMPWPLLGRALRDAIAFGPQVVHAQSPFIAGRLARRIALRARAPLVFTHHTRFAEYRHYLGPLAAGPLRGLSTALLDRHLHRFWESCDAVVAPSRDLAAEIEARLVPGRRRPIVCAIASGIDVGAIRAIDPVDPRPLAGWPPRSLVVASHGRLAPEKSVDLLVEAVAIAARTAPDIHLLLVGGGPSARMLRSQVTRAGIGERVHLTGPLPRDAALALIRGSDLLAFASRTETQGLVLAEALATGLPVVALEGPAIGEAVRDGVDGVVVAAEPPDGRARRMGESIAHLATDGARRGNLAAAAAAGAGRFDVAKRTAEMVALYRELLSAAIRA
jgi:1,2-diacylglycerol 3-alpha-glucosyltransferase